MCVNLNLELQQCSRYLDLIPHLDNMKKGDVAEQHLPFGYF